MDFYHENMEHWYNETIQAQREQMRQQMEQSRIAHAAYIQAKREDQITELIRYINHLIPLVYEVTSKS